MQSLPGDHTTGTRCHAEEQQDERASSALSDTTLEQDRLHGSDQRDACVRSWRIGADHSSHPQLLANCMIRTGMLRLVS
jgi:hypothetical protein